MLTFISAHVENPAFVAFLIVLACLALMVVRANFGRPQASLHSPATIQYRGLQLRMHPSLPAGKIVVLDPQGYALTKMTMKMLDTLSKTSARAVLLSNTDFAAVLATANNRSRRASERNLVA
ncbi:MAG: hypothetical protein JWO51_5016 [Rhodospirillales bacterium]|nr:hypothetical protein [Rhodospirillales bacterium]